VELIPTKSKASPSEARYVVRVGELAIEVDASFDEATLSRLLKVVSGW
jgi:hypothetical protein